MHKTPASEYGVPMTQVDRVRTTAVDEQLCFALYSTSRAMTSWYRPLLETLGLTYPQYLVLLVLWERGESSVTGIGQALHLETGTLSPLLKRLEAGGFVTRTRQIDDERSVLVGLTERGRALEAHAADVQHAVSAATGLSDAEIATLLDALQVLGGSLRAAAGY